MLVRVNTQSAEGRVMNRREALATFAATLAGLPVTSTDVHATKWVRLPASPIATRKIPSSGQLLPVIGLGTWQTFDVGNDVAARKPLEEVIGEFIALGGRVIDSSPMYGRSEEVAGDILASTGHSGELFIATKVWTSGKAAGIAQMEESMRKLRRPRPNPIDLMQVHNLLDVETHLETLKAWKQGGQVRYIGVTHYTAGAYDAVAKVIAKHQVDFLQINYSAGEREAERRLLPLAKERGIAVIVNRPFAGGELFRRLRGTPLPPWVAEIDCKSWAQLMLKFVLGHPAVTCAIPATSKVEHLRDNMAGGLERMADEAIRTKIVQAVL
jgi:diketogulonate reductase-like aldo/keto reductase